MKQTLALISMLLVAPAARATSFGPGEQARYDVRYLGLSAGEAKVMVGAPQQQQGREVWPIVCIARSRDVAGVWPIRDTFVSYWDPTSGRSLGSDFIADENGRRSRRRVSFGPERGTARIERQSAGSAVDRYVVEVPENVMDLAAATFALRTQALTPGRSFEIPVFTGTNHFLMRVTVEGAETISRDAVPTPAVRVRIAVAFGGSLATRRDLIAWFSRDTHQLPLRIEADMLLGTVSAELVDFQPGLGAPGDDS